jgi:hypothetical protein
MLCSDDKSEADKRRRVQGERRDIGRLRSAHWSLGGRVTGAGIDEGMDEEDGVFTVSINLRLSSS